MLIVLETVKFLLLVWSRPETGDFKDLSQNGGRSKKCRLPISFTCLSVLSCLVSLTELPQRLPPKPRYFPGKVLHDIFLVSLFAFNVPIARYHNVNDEHFVVFLIMDSYIRLTVVYHVTHQAYGEVSRDVSNHPGCTKKWSLMGKFNKISPKLNCELIV